MNCGFILTEGIKEAISDCLTQVIIFILMDIHDPEIRIQQDILKKHFRN